ncbi:TSUP family transporter [Chloroflexota bacterium]
MRLFTRVPELTLLLLLIIIGYAVAGIFSQVEAAEAISSSSIWLIAIGSFLISTAIAIFAVIGGVGGGVIFTPIMLAFTSIDTLVIRAIGLVVAMFSGLISTGPFMKLGLADLKIVLYCALPFVVGATGGSMSAIYLRSTMGETGDAILRLLLGILLLFVAGLFIKGGNAYEYPKVKHVDRLSKKLGLNGSYMEQSLGKPVNYQVSRASTGGFLFLLVGLGSGFFGLGGGWAAVPVLNLVMSLPLKISAASSGVLLAIGNATAVWPYITYGALIAVFAVPWMLGQVIGGIIGAHILANIKAGFVRYLLIAFLVLSCIKLLSRGIEGLFGIDIPAL